MDLSGILQVYIPLILFFEPLTNWQILCSLITTITWMIILDQWTKDCILFESFNIDI